MSLVNLSFCKNKQKIAASYPKSIVDEHILKMIYAMMKVYYYSKNPGRAANLGPTSLFLSELLAEYYESVGIENPIINCNEWGDCPTISKNLDIEKHFVLCSGGKDSVHALLTLLKDNSPENIMIGYCTNINRSESSYEAKAVQAIAEKAGVKYVILPVVNSIKSERSNHNIGLRNQLLVALLLPYIVEFGAENVWTGLIPEFWKQEDGVMVTDRESGMMLFEKALRQSNAILSIHCHPTDDLREIDILEDMCRDYPEYMDIGASCYTQMNFREKHHKTLSEKFPKLKIYHGCGSCIKCQRINGMLSVVNKSDEYKKLGNYVLRAQRKKFPDDKTLGDICNLIRNTYDLEAGND